MDTAAFGGSGGDGGSGLVFLGSGAVTLANEGSIAGGDGGARGDGSHNTSGVGGNGIVGAGLSITNSGTISGGLSGDGTTRADAILFTGGSNTLLLHGTSWQLNGGIKIQSGSLTFIQANDETVANVISGGGEVIVDAPGMVTLSGQNTYTGGTAIVSSMLSVGRDANLGDVSGGVTLSNGTLQATAGFTSNRTVSLSGGSTVNVDSGQQLTLNGVISGSGGLAAGGAGTLTLNGANTYTGGTTVDAGTLAVGDAAHPSASVRGDVQVNAAGTLRGHGSIAGDVNSTGTVWPGGSIGTLTIGGNYTQSPSGTLQMEVSPMAASQLKVGGTASLAGTLSLLYAPGTYTTKTYTLVSANAVNGTFSTVEGNVPAGVTQGVAYESNAVDLNLTAAAQPTQPVQPTQSAQPLVVAPTQATIFGAVGSSALRAGQGVNEALLERLAGPCGVVSAGASSQVSATDDSASAAGTPSSTAQSLSCARQGNGLWVQAQGTDTHIDGNNGAPNMHDRRYGFRAGVDRPWKGWTVGVAGGYSHADVTESGNGSEGTLDTLRIAGYGAKNLGAYTLAGTLGYAYDFSSTTRSFGALGSAKGDGHGQEFTAGLQASRAWSLGPVVLTPRVGVRYAYLDGLSTDESGPTAQNLGVANQHLQSLQPYVGVTLDYPFTLRNNDRPTSVQLRAGYAYETLNTGRDVSVTAADGTGFVIAGTRDTRGLVTAGVGATLPIGKTASAYLRYDSVLPTGNVNAQSLQAGVDYRF